MNIIDKINLKFTSGNTIPVERATITAEEWEQVKMFYSEMMERIDLGESVDDLIDEDD